jgi:ferredoxin
MRFLVEKAACIGCDICVSVCPAVFRMAGDGKAEAFAEANGNAAQAEQALCSCPTGAIRKSD